MPDPEQAPDQPVKAEVLFGVAVRVTTVPGKKLAVHGAPVQFNPAGALTTVPPPLPGRLTVKVAVTKFAVTLKSEFIVTVHVPFPEHAPLHPVKTETELETAVRVTCVPSG